MMRCAISNYGRPITIEKRTDLKNEKFQVNNSALKRARKVYDALKDK